MDSHKHRKKDNTNLSEKDNQKPTDHNQNINTKRVIEKTLWNIDLLMKRIFCNVCINTKQKNEQHQSKNEVIILVVFETSVH